MTKGLDILLKRKALADHKVTILIGPEGDFSEAEINLALSKDYTPVAWEIPDYAPRRQPSRLSYSSSHKQLISHHS